MQPQFVRERRPLPKINALVNCFLNRELLHWLSKPITPIGLVAFLSLNSGWLMGQAIAPSAAQAYPRQANIALFVQPGDTYEDVLSRAEGAARSVVQQRFARDPRLTEVNAIIVAEKDDMAVPLLSLKVNRTQAQSLATNRRWITYYPNAKSLLGLPSGVSETNQSAGIATPTGTSGFLPVPDASGRIQPSSTVQTTGVTTPTADSPTTGSQTPILPSRIPTPAGIGK